jgi:hypothetical protein
MTSPFFLGKKVFYVIHNVSVKIQVFSNQNVKMTMNMKKKHVLGV